MSIYINDTITKYSLLENKLYFVEQTALKIRSANLEGCIAEAGVYRGGCARLLASIFNDKSVYLFDSFEGMMENDEDKSGLHSKGNFSDVSLEEVQQYLKDKPNCKFFKGWFPKSAEFLSDEKFSFVHVDMDYYQSTKSCIDIFWNRLVLNGVMIFDDYEWMACPGVKKALDEFFTNRDDFVTERYQGLCSIAYFKIK